MWRTVAASCLALALLASLPGNGHAEKKSSTLRFDVPARNWAGAALEGLPKDGTLTFAIKVSGAVEVLLFDAAAYQGFPDGGTPLFRGETASTIGFTVILPQAGTYYLVFDNRAGDTPRILDIFVEAATADERSSRGRAPTVARQDVQDTGAQLRAAL